MWHNELERINRGLGDVVGRAFKLNALQPGKDLSGRGSTIGGSTPGVGSSQTSQQKAGGGLPIGTLFGGGLSGGTTAADIAALGIGGPAAGFTSGAAGAAAAGSGALGAGAAAGGLTSAGLTAAIKKFGISGALSMLAGQGAFGSPTGGGAIQGLTGTAATAQDQAMRILLDQLFGQTDQRQANIQRADISRGGQQQTSDLRGELARTGIGGLNSGVAQALLGASGGATQDRLARFEAAEAQAERQRQTDAVNLFLDLVAGPNIQQQGINAGIGIENQRRRSNESAANQAFLGSLLGIGADIFQSERAR